ncbi:MULTISPECIES: A24 family peptidase [Paenibacillus]|uniref:Prepilin peptidase n=1 Tax=Paenibacillus odorifer TaxID=189426 RepID=A0A1R0Y5L5_9BACL|nr:MULTISPECIES: prepilin peptidase [Paenibacillus]AIQ34237.1 peptidase A24 [Paenibacillus sp. FSL R5-0345]OMD42638.1 prepilin peptidase [Paenibacillus odorifer]
MAEWAFWGCFPFLAAAFITDIKSMRIPNWITVSGLLAGLLAQVLMNGWDGLLKAGVGAVAGFSVLLIMHLIGAVGAGDVKLFAGIGAWTGMLFTLQVVVYSVLFGALIGWIIVLMRRETGRRTRKIINTISGFILLKSSFLFKNKDSELLRFPFMLAVVPGTICAYLYF